MAADYYTLNAAGSAYNAGAKLAGLVVLAPDLDVAVKHGSPEDADDAITGTISAAERLMKWGAALAEKAQSMVAVRKAKHNDVDALIETPYYVREILPTLLKEARRINDMP